MSDEPRKSPATPISVAWLCCPNDAEEQNIEWSRRNTDPFEFELDEHPPPIGNDRRF